MKNKSTLTFFFTALLLSGCATQPQDSNLGLVLDSDEMSNCDKAIYQNLLKAVDNSGKNLLQLRKIKEGDWDGEIASNAPPASSAMNKSVTLGWQGSIEDVLTSLAAISGYKLLVTGKKPPQPVIVNINETDEALYKVLEGIGWQAGRNVAVVRNDVDRVIKLIYRKG